MEYSYGHASEIQLADLMLKTFDVIPSKKKYAIFDYEGESALVELKTRRIKSTDYDDYMIGGNKLDYALTSEKKAYFVYKFLDGVFYWQYDPSVYLRSDINGRQDRGRDERQKIHYLPANLFIKLL